MLLRKRCYLFFWSTSELYFCMCTIINLFFCRIAGIRSLFLSAVSSRLLNEDLCGLSDVIPWAPPMQRRAFFSTRAAKDIPFNYRYPPMTKKPQWWWRSLACLPYLIPLHQTWMHAETAYHLHPFFAQYELLTDPFMEVIKKLPIWFSLAYILVVYLGVVRRKEWPHFFRFHVVTGMLLGILLQVVGFISTRWVPRGVYWGKIGMHFWTALAFAFLFTVLESMRCALAGMYNDIPFVSDAAYIQLPYY